MITQIDPVSFADASSVQVDSDAGDSWHAIEEIENWAAENGFVRSSEYSPRQVLIEGHRRFRSVCYRISPEERAAFELSQRQMTERGELLKGLVHHAARGGQ
jgi:hypothetical protein